MDQDVKKKVLRQISYGMYVVGSTADGDSSAGTVNWLSQASFSPPLIMMGVKTDSGLHETVKKSNSFSVNVLSADQKQIAEDFFRPSKVEGNNINGHAFAAGATGAPVLDEVYCYFECNVVGSVENGDHSVFVGEVVDAQERRDDKPMEMWDTGWFYGG
jgi:flavin reductase (DIM6/NTAB) family NADH-FMN oxidoreductase RutF